MRKKEYDLREMKIHLRRLKIAIKTVEEGVTLMEDLGTPKITIDEAPTNRVVTWGNQVLTMAGLDPQEQQEAVLQRRKTKERPH